MVRKDFKLFEMLRKVIHDARKIFDCCLTGYFFLKSMIMQESVYTGEKHISHCRACSGERIGLLHPMVMLRDGISASA